MLHFTNPDTGRSACGRGTGTTDLSAVECNKCLNSHSLRAARGEQRLAARAAEERTVVIRQEALDMVRDIAHEIADGRGLCGTYDEIATEINERLAGTGLTYTPRVSDRTINVEYSITFTFTEETEVEKVADDDAALDEVREYPRGHTPNWIDVVMDNADEYTLGVSLA